MAKTPATVRRRRAAAADPTPPARPPLVLAPEPEAPSSPEVLESLLEQFGGDGGLTVAVERKRGSRGPTGYLGTHDVTDGLLDEIKALYGGGEYRGRVYQSGKYATSINFAVAGPPRDGNMTPAADRAGELAPFAQVLAGIMDTQKELLAEVRRGREKTTSGVDDVVSIARALKELTPLPVAPAAAAAAPDTLVQFETFLRLRELVASDAAPSGGGTDWGPVIKDGITPLVGALREELALRRETMNRQLRPTGRPVSIVPPEHLKLAIPRTLAELSDEVPAFARTWLAACAANEKEPSLYAETIIDQLPGDVVDVLPALLAPDDAAAQLVAAIPEWAPYPAWFGDLVTAMREHLTERAADGEGEHASAD